MCAADVVVVDSVKHFRVYTDRHIIKPLSLRSAVWSFSSDVYTKHGNPIIQ